MKNVIVTGATGFLGRNMVRHLCAKGYKVYAVVRPDSRNLALLPRHENVVPVICSLNMLSGSEMLQGNVYEAFFHFAWSGVNRAEIDDENVQTRNMEMSINVLHEAIDLGCDCFIFAGSRSEYGEQQGKYIETADCDPQVAYGKSKLEFGRRARELCRDTRMKYIHARIFSIYGPDDHPWSLIYTAVTKMLRNEPMDLSPCTQLWNFMEVRDMADLMLTFYEQSALIPEEDSSIFNVATSDIRPLREYVEDIYRITGSSSELRFGAFKQAAESAVSLVPDMTKVEEVFDWRQKIPFASGIEYMIGQIKTSGCRQIGDLNA